MLGKVWGYFRSLGEELSIDSVTAEFEYLQRAHFALSHLGELQRNHPEGQYRRG